MKVELWMTGKTAFAYLQEGMVLYEKRLSHYLPFRVVIFPDVKKAKNLNPEQLKEKESEAVLSKIKKEDFLILLDEHGKQYSSVDFARFLEHKLQLSHSRLVLLVGGAFGFSAALYARGNAKVSLSKMTFSHQMVRLFALEQIYRSMTILRGEPYHNE
jgi:23S rRNA (pseudouridine1915-N3)-methyltransferase